MDTPDGAAHPVDVAVIGLGYVGLPLVHAAVHAGLRVVGFDTDDAKVSALNAGRSYVDDLSDVDIAGLRAQGFEASTDPTVLAAARTIVICVPTPLDENSAPELSAVRGAGAVVAQHMSPGTLVVLESTTWPGTTEEVLAPILETSGLTAGEGFALAYSPERIDPGNAEFGLVNTPKVVGGLTGPCRERAAEFYAQFVQRVVQVKGLREAEMAKLIENTYRHVNIALVNEMAVFCDELSVDIWESIEAAATKPFGFMAFRPGPGVGGHCIPIDPNYLSFKVRSLGYPFRFVELAQEVNDRMPAYVTSRVARLLNDVSRSVRGSRILLLGVTYKPNIADVRQTPAVPLARRLLQLGAVLEYADPHIREWQVDGASITRCDDPVEAGRTADLTVLLQAHSAFDLEAIAAASTLIFDASGVLQRAANVTRL